LCRHDLSLQRRCEPLRLGELKPKLSQAGPLITLEARNLHLGRHPDLQLRYQLHRHTSFGTSPPSFRAPIK